jgi:hypothetical protein
MLTTEHRSERGIPGAETLPDGDDVGLDRQLIRRQLPTRPTPLTTSSKQIRNPCSSRRSARPFQKRSGGEAAGIAAALTGSQKKAATVSGPASSRRRSSASSAASPLGSNRHVDGGMWRCDARYWV